jgi:hypothetical protein
MTTSKTFLGNVPNSYRRAWLEIVFPKRAAALGGSTNGGGILDLPSDTESEELQRLRRFGACWSWWGVPADLQQQWWDLDG